MIYDMTLWNPDFFADKEAKLTHGAYVASEQSEATRRDEPHEERSVL